MEYGLIVTKNQLEKLDNNKIDYTFWDAFDFLQMDADNIEINFESIKERDRATKIIKAE